MNLYLIRHEKAEEHAKTFKDFDRNLTPEGIKRLKNSIKFWKNFLKIDIIISSPYLRALQTAQIIAEDFELSLEIHKDLGCGTNSQKVLNLLDNYSDFENIALVGHEPDISNIISDLTANSQLNIEIKKGSLTKISFFNQPRIGNGILEYSFPPSIFNKK
ncbi:MAG TPA: phosphohistidine phosphatase SixA [Ignavibacteriales bacterium]|nr:phosphohistidine phosphatase SixA [Ignavibacteriales bacterium]